MMMIEGKKTGECIYDMHSPVFIHKRPVIHGIVWFENVYLIQ